MSKNNKLLTAKDFTVGEKVKIKTIKKGVNIGIIKEILVYNLEIEIIGLVDGSPIYTGRYGFNEVEKLSRITVNADGTVSYNEPTTEEIKADEIDFSKIQKGDRIWVEFEIKDIEERKGLGKCFHTKDDYSFYEEEQYQTEIIRHIPAPAETITLEEANEYIFKQLGKKIKG